MDKDVLGREEAERRAGQVSNAAYEIDLGLRAGDKEYYGDVAISFEGGADGTFLEFIGGEIDRFEINGIETEPEWDGARIQLPAELLGQQNQVRVVYINRYDHSGEGFHQFIDPEDGAEYLYTQFEPYSAHRLFPCFDQPDIKATYQLTTTAPKDWVVVSSARVVSEEETYDDRLKRTFEQTLPFSTYLFSVIAGHYGSATGEHNGLELGLYTRRTLMEYMDADEILHVTSQGLDYFAQLFGRSYPFTKYDQAFVPEFNWGGMENVAAVTYVDSLIFRDPPTRDQRIRRDEILLHELAHMWFGDLVTMKWWDDLWLNETFATFAAYLAMEASGRWDDVWQDFNTRNKVVAYRDDQRPTTHPIAGAVPDTNTVFLNFDQVTYGKGASVMRQLVATIGLDAFADGLKTYFRRYEFSNTTLADFLASLEEGSGEDLAGWAARWLKTANVNTLAAEWEADGALLGRLTLHQRAPEEYPTLRPHTVEVALAVRSNGGVRIESLPATIDDASEPVANAAGLAAPDLVFPNFNDLTYTKVALDDLSLGFVRSSLSNVSDGLLRHQLWQSLWEMVRDRELSSLDYLELMTDHLGEEQSELIVHLVGATARGTLARYVPADDQDQRIRSYVALCRQAIEVAPPGDLRVLWARSLVGVADHPDDLALAGRLVDGDEGVEVAIDQEMRWSVAVRWSAHGIPGASARVAAELERDPGDRGLRARLRAEVSAPDADAKAEAWARIHSQGFQSLAYAKSAMAGFQWRQQAELLAPYADEFFDRIPVVVSDWEWEAAKAYFYGLHPGYRLDGETLTRTKELTTASDTRLRRLALEAVDDLERAMACRALASSQPAVDPTEEPQQTA